MHICIYIYIYIYIYTSTCICMYDVQFTSYIIRRTMYANKLNKFYADIKCRNR